MPQPYDFEAFLARMATLGSYADIIIEANEACASAERASSGRGGPRQRELGSLRYAHRIKEFLYFLQHGSRPGSATEQDFSSYRPVVEALVVKGHFKPEILGLFRKG